MRDNEQRESGSVPHPPSCAAPPSKKDLLEALMAAIVDLFGGADEERRSKVRLHLIADCQPSYEDDLKEIVEFCYSDFPEVDLQAIIREQIDKWKTEKEKVTSFDSRTWGAVTEFVYRWFKAAVNDRYMSFPENYWTVIKPGLSCLMRYSAYPFDENLDRGLLERAAQQFPDIDIIRQINRKIIWWEENPDALRVNKSPRRQLWEFFEHAYPKEKTAQEKDEES